MHYPSVFSYCCCCNKAGFVDSTKKLYYALLCSIHLKLKLHSHRIRCRARRAGFMLCCLRTNMRQHSARLGANGTSRIVHVEFTGFGRPSRASRIKPPTGFNVKLTNTVLLSSSSISCRLSPAFGDLSPNLLPGFNPWTPMGDFHPQIRITLSERQQSKIQQEQANKFTVSAERFINHDVRLLHKYLHVVKVS